jgi:hypothetical protein
MAKMLIEKARELFEKATTDEMKAIYQEAKDELNIKLDADEEKVKDILAEIQNAKQKINGN